MSNEHERGIEAAMEAGTPKGIRDRRSHRERVEDSISAYLSALAPQAGDNAEEPVAWLPEKAPHAVLKAVAWMKVDPKSRAFEDTRGEKEVIGFQRAEQIYAAIRAALASHPCTSTPVVSHNAPDLEDKWEAERLRFEGDLDKWMKIIGAGITGYQPEAYAVMDMACGELVRARAKIDALRAALEPFSDFAGAVFSRNFNSHEDIMELDGGDGDYIALSAGDFFEARRVFETTNPKEATP